MVSQRNERHRVALLGENNVVWHEFFIHKRHTLPKATKLWFYRNGRQMSCNHL